MVELEARRLIMDAALRASHGEIFCWAYANPPKMSFSKWSKKVINTDDVKGWVAEFTRYGHTGELAGAVCGLLVKEERWQDIIDILSVCQPFSWDS